MTQEKNGIGTLGNVITIIVFIAIITVGLWGAISAVKLAPRMFGSITNTFRGDDPIELSLSSSELISGEVFTLSWKDAKRDNGLYTISYACVDDFEMRAPTAGQTLGPIPCDMPYSIPGTKTSVDLMPIVKIGVKAEIPLTISYISREGEQKTKGMTSLVVNNNKIVVEEDKKEKDPVDVVTEVIPSTPTQPAGIPDLTVRTIAVGVVDPMTGSFIPKNTFGSYETVSFKFDVANRGNGKSGAWTFSTNFPTQTQSLYHPPMQQPLGPGDHIEFTLSFSQPISGNISINIDPSNAVAESNESNNYLSEYISVVY
jgi:hypothetical protein